LHQHMVCSCTAGTHAYVSPCCLCSLLPFCK
jgi:hypothetical protein